MIDRIKLLAQLVFRRLGPVRFEDPLRTEPVSRLFGMERGTSIDRLFIERFLDAEAAVIRGRVLEVGEAGYATRFGRDKPRVDVLHVEPGHPGVTLVGDLTRPDSLPADTFDCFICTQTLNFIFDVSGAVAGAARLLKPGGTLLATVAGLCQVSRYDMNRWGDFWRFSTAAAERLMAPHFPAARIDYFGNLVAAKALLDGIAVQDLPDPELLWKKDADYPVIVTIVARRPA